MKKNRRNLSGILLLDKPAGMSSNMGLQIVKRIYNAAKAGHTGSLDPLATGMLPICFGEATKFCHFLLEADKVYQVTAKLGIKTTTGDAEGEIIAQAPVKSINRDSIEKLLAKFLGSTQQTPSMYSALKHNGQPLYQLARQGIEVERKSREIFIHELTLTDYTESTISFKVHCSKGTYVRTLVEDMGEMLGCGAHVIELRRQSVGSYQQAQMLTLPDLQALADDNNLAALDSYLLTIDSSVAAWPDLHLSAATAFYLQQGQAVMVPHAPLSGWVRLFTEGNHFLGVGEMLANGKVAPRRLIHNNLT